MKLTIDEIRAIAVAKLGRSEKSVVVQCKACGAGIHEPFSCEDWGCKISHTDPWTLILSLVNKIKRLETVAGIIHEAKGGITLPSEYKLAARAEIAESKLEAVREWDRKMREYEWQPGLLQMAYEQLSDQLRDVLDGKENNG